MAWHTRTFYRRCHGWLFAVALGLAACADEPQAPTPVPPLFSHGGNHSISGTVLGPDGSSICNFIPAGSSVRVRTLDPVNPPLIGPTQFVACPAPPNSNPISYLLTVDPGTYRVQAGMPNDPGIGMLPFRYLEPGDVVVNGGDIVQNIQVQNGIPMGGLATLDGSPVAGVDITLSYDFPQPIAAAIGVSGPDGAWDDALPARSPMLVQGGVRYTAAAGCALLGTRRLQAPPSGSFLFPTEVSAINCTLETGGAVPFTHDLTRLVLTPGPAQIGGLGPLAPGCSPPLPGDLGPGFGVQFPVSPSGDPPYAPVPTEHLFCGGLLIGIAPNVVLSGVDIGNYGLDCGAACVDLGLDGELSFADDGSRGKKVTWSYTDAPSPERVGLRVIQRSFDGRPPADYVLFRFSLRNLGRSARTLHVGFFGDWDVDNDALDDVGATDLGGRLMYMTSTNPNDQGTFVGTLLLSDVPVSGTLFFNRSNEPQSLSDQLDALSGAVVRQTIGPEDNKVIHAVGPITLAPRGKADVWMAVVAGEDLAGLLANAAAAEEDVLARRSIASSVAAADVDLTRVDIAPFAPAARGPGEPVRRPEATEGVHKLFVPLPRP